MLHLEDDSNYMESGGLGSKCLRKYVYSSSVVATRCPKRARRRVRSQLAHQPLHQEDQRTARSVAVRRLIMDRVESGLIAFEDVTTEHLGPDLFTKALGPTQMWHPIPGILGRAVLQQW